MDPSTVFRWIQGERAPTGKGLKRLLEWHDRQKPVGSPASPSASRVLPDLSTADVAELMDHAQRETATNLIRLSRIQGYAEAVLQMLEGVTDRQRHVVNSLAPWAKAEEDAEIKRMRAELDATAVQDDATPPAAAPPHQKRKGPE